MTPLEKALRALSAAQQERVWIAFASLAEGLLSVDEFVDVVTDMVLAGNARGYALGAATVRSQIEQQIAAAEVTPAVTKPRHLDAQRVGTALGTILAADEDTLMQLRRLASNEPLQAAADGSSDVIRSSGHVTGWTRTIEADACELCVWLRKEHLRPGGYVYPDTANFHRHTGCVCGQNPVTRRTNKKEQAA